MHCMEDVEVTNDIRPARDQSTPPSMIGNFYFSSDISHLQT
jgi:hypothetical protein